MVCLDGAPDKNLSRFWVSLRLRFLRLRTFESDSAAKTGKAPMPKKGEKMLGGHAVMAVGYDDAQGRFLVRNSWGPKWGIGGNFTFPYDYLINDALSADFWTIRLVEVSG